MDQQNVPQAGLSLGLKIVCALIPLVGLILYFVNGNEPAKKKDACTFALIGVGIGIVLNVIMMFFLKDKLPAA